MENEKKPTEETLQKAGKGLKSVVGEFKEFISKGNVLDMAVGLIVGSAFTAIVNSLVDDILMPIIGTVLAGINFSSLGITIPWGNHPFIAIGSFLNTVITFLLTALCVFLIVKVMNMFRRKQEEKPAPPKPSKEEILLTEIRDLLAAFFRGDYIVYCGYYETCFRSFNSCSSSCIAFFNSSADIFLISSGIITLSSINIFILFCLPKINLVILFESF